MNSYSWLLYALAGAFFAAVVSILSKRAMKEMPFTAAMVVQGAALLLTLVVAVSFARRWKDVAGGPKWAVGMLALAGVAAGLSWLCGYRALQLSDVAKSAPIDKMSLPIAVLLAFLFLGERPSGVNYLGIGLMTVGAVLVARS